jgi:hypothetical protein
MIAESKLDNTLQDNLFQVDDYNLKRRDGNQQCGGLFILIKSDFPSGRKQYLESNKLENICYELYVNATMLSVNSSFTSSNLYLRLFMFIYAAIKFFGCRRLACLRSWNKSVFTPEVELVERLSFGAFDSSFISIKNESLKSGK